MRFLFFGAIHHQTLRANSIVGANDRTKCGRGVTEDHDRPTLFERVQSQTAVALRNGHAKQSQLAHLCHNFLGNVVFLGDLLFQRDEALGDEALQRCEQLVQRGLINGHECFLGRSAAMAP